MVTGVRPQATSSEVRSRPGPVAGRAAWVTYLGAGAGAAPLADHQQISLGRDQDARFVSGSSASAATTRTCGPTAGLEGRGPPAPCSPATSARATRRSTSAPSRTTGPRTTQPAVQGSRRGPRGRLHRAHPGAARTPGHERLPDQPQPQAVRARLGRVGPEPRDREQRRALQPRLDRRPDRRGPALLPGEPGVPPVADRLVVRGFFDEVLASARTGGALVEGRLGSTGRDRSERPRPRRVGGGRAVMHRRALCPVDDPGRRGPAASRSMATTSPWSASTTTSTRSATPAATRTSRCPRARCTPTTRDRVLEARSPFSPETATPEPCPPPGRSRCTRCRRRRRRPGRSCGCRAGGRSSW